MAKNRKSRSVANQFHTIQLDGSMVHAAWAQLFQRLASIVTLAIEGKRHGVGCFARPEADIALLGNLATMHAIDPEGGWLDACMITYLYSIDDAIRRAPDIWWGSDWLDPVQSQYGTFAECNADALLKSGPRTISGGSRAIAQLLIGTTELKGAVKPARDVVKRRRKLFDLIQQRAQHARSFLQRPDKSYPKINAISLEAIPAELGEPLWRNDEFPSMPRSEAAYVRRFGHVLMRGLSMAMSEAHRSLDLTPRYLGLQMLPDGYENYQPSHLKYWLDCGPFSPSLHGLLDAAILDGILGAPPDELLRACLSASRYQAHQTRWSQPFSPKWLHIEEWDGAVLSCMVNDEQSLKIWSEHWRVNARHYGPGVRACCEVLDEWVGTRRFPADPKLPKSLDRFEVGFIGAMQGLVKRDPRACTAGVRQMLDNHTRVDYRLVRGQWFFDLCLQAIAVQRMARREGLHLEVSSERPNDLDLVNTPDPIAPALPWCPLPGIDLVCGSTESIAWPSLYLNQPVMEAVEPPSN